MEKQDLQARESRWQNSNQLDPGAKDKKKPIYESKRMVLNQA